MTWTWRELTEAVDAAASALKAQGLEASIPYSRNMYDKALQMMTQSYTPETEMVCMRAALVHGAVLAPLGMDGWEALMSISLSLEPFAHLEKYKPFTETAGVYGLLLANYVIAHCLHDTWAPPAICARALTYLKRDTRFTPWQARVELVQAQSIFIQYGITQQRYIQRYAATAAEILSVSEPDSEACIYAKYFAGQGDGQVWDGSEWRLAALGPQDIFHYQVDL